MKFLLLFSFLVTQVGFSSDSNLKANSVEKEVNVYWASNRSYYACSYAEAQARKFLRALGAQDIEMECSGGIEPHIPFSNPFPLKLTAKFSSMQAEDSGSESATEQVVVLRGREACDLNVEIIKSILKKIDHKLVKKSSTCFDARGSFRFEVSVLK